MTENVEVTHHQYRGFNIGKFVVDGRRSFLAPFEIDDDVRYLAGRTMAGIRAEIDKFIDRLGLNEPQYH